MRAAAAKSYPAALGSGATTMPKRAASDAGDAATPAKAARPAAASPRKRAPAVAYIVPDTVRSIPEAANADAFAANIPPRDAAHQASTFKVMCW